MTIAGTSKTETSAIGDRELRLTRLIDAPPAKVYEAWTNPELLVKWFAPLPYTTPRAELDVRPGGTSTIVMKGPDGNEMPNTGIYLEVAPDQKLVFTDAYGAGWTPNEGHPFMTVILTFDDEHGKTRYTARVLHWTSENREIHEKMGFHQGWATCTEQLAALVES